MNDEMKVSERLGDIQRQQGRRQDVGCQVDDLILCTISGDGRLDHVTRVLCDTSALREDPFAVSLFKPLVFVTRHVILVPRRRDGKIASPKNADVHTHCVHELDTCLVVQDASTCFHVFDWVTRSWHVPPCAPFTHLAFVVQQSATVLIFKSLRSLFEYDLVLRQWTKVEIELDQVTLGAEVVQGDLYLLLDVEGGAYETRRFTRTLADSYSCKYLCTLVVPHDVPDSCTVCFGSCKTLEQNRSILAATTTPLSSVEFTLNQGALPGVAMGPEHLYIPDEELILTLPDLPTRVRLTRESIYFIAGDTRIWCYHLATHPVWTRLPPQPNWLRNLEAVLETQDGSVFMAVGNRVTRFDTATSSWVRLRDLPNVSLTQCLFELEGDVFAVGESSVNKSELVLTYDKCNHVWSRIEM